MMAHARPLVMCAHHAKDAVQAARGRPAEAVCLRSRGGDKGLLADANNHLNVNVPTGA